MKNMVFSVEEMLEGHFNLHAALCHLVYCMRGPCVFINVGESYMH